MVPRAAANPFAGSIAAALEIGVKFRTLLLLMRLNNMRKIKAITAVREGAPIPDVAHQFGIHIATLYRWLKAFDPEHPIASLRPKKMGPKGPRWGDDVIFQVMELIRPYPNLLGRRRIAQALRKRGVVLSEPTVGQILVVARERIADERARNGHSGRNNAGRLGVEARRQQRDVDRRAHWNKLLEPAYAPGLSWEERLRRIAQALAKKGWKIQVKDLTPELRDIADTYLADYAKREVVDPSEIWLAHADKHYLPGELDKQRAGALNHKVRNFGPTASPPARISISGSDESEHYQLLPPAPR